MSCCTATPFESVANLSIKLHSFLTFPLVRRWPQRARLQRVSEPVRSLQAALRRARTVQQLRREPVLLRSQRWLLVLLLAVPLVRVRDDQRAGRDHCVARALDDPRAGRDHRVARALDHCAGRDLDLHVAHDLRVAHDHVAQLAPS